MSCFFFLSFFRVIINEICSSALLRRGKGERIKRERAKTSCRLVRDGKGRDLGAGVLNVARGTKQEVDTLSGNG